MNNETGKCIINETQTIKIADKNNIIANLLKKVGTISEEEIYKVIQKTWAEEVLPTTWTEANTALI